MPKKSASKKAAAKKTAVQKPIIKSTAAFVLLVIAEIILFLNAFVWIFLRNWIISLLNSYTLNGQVNLWGTTLTILIPTQWQALQIGFTMMMLGLFTIYSYHKITEGDKTWIWFLFIMGFFTILIGRIDTGILMMVAALIYFGKFKKK